MEEKLKQAVRRRMKQTKIRQYELAEHAGVTQNTISSWLNNDKGINSKTLCDILGYVGISFIEEGVDTRPIGEEERLLDKLDKIINGDKEQECKEAI